VLLVQVGWFTAPFPSMVTRFCRGKVSCQIGHSDIQECVGRDVGAGMGIGRRRNGRDLEVLSVSFCPANSKYTDIPNVQ
jgi:hypothetical protein